MTPLSHPIATPPPLSRGGIGLRAIRSSDARELQQLLTENRGWLQPWEATHPGGVGAIPGSVPMRPMIRALQRQLRTGSGVSFVILDAAEIVGQLTISDISGGALRSASIGYWVAKRVAGRGITPTAVALAVDYAMEVLGLHRIEICIRPENTASLRVVEKLGMRFEGRRLRYIHIAGQWCDHDCFAVTREEIPAGMRARLGAASTSGGSQTVQ